MILGRSTPQWLALIAAAAGLIQIIVPVLTPSVDPGTVSIVLGGAVTFLGVFIAFLANTATTPLASPRLPSGTVVGVLNDAGQVIGESKV